MANADMMLCPLDNATDSHYQRRRNLPACSLQQILEDRGIRLTARRKALLEILENSDQHLDAAGLLKAAQAQMQIDRATVYRTLDLLKRQGLIDELDLMHMRGEMHYYEARIGDQEHFHFVCFGCGRVNEMQSQLYSELKQQIAREQGVAIEVSRLELGGWCSQCREAGADKNAHEPKERLSA